MARNDLMQISNRDLIALWKWYQKAPKQFAASTGMLINNFAFGSREESIKLIGSRMIIRAPGFVKSRIQVQKSHFRLPIASQKSRYGSVRKPRFSGWIEQEHGQRKARKYFAAIKGRGGKRRKIKRGARLDKPFLTPDRYPKRRGFKGRNRDHLIQIYLAQLDRMNYSKPFVITGHTKIPSGVYQFGQERTGWGQRKIEALQLFHRPKVTKRVRWMRLGVMRYFRRTNILKEWKRVTKRMLDKGLK